MERKKYFQERTVDDIIGLGPQRAFRGRGLVERIIGLGPDQALEIRTLVTPARFYANDNSGARASRLNYKHGDFIRLTQPGTQSEAYARNEIPLAVRARDFADLGNMKEEEINFVGYTWMPVQGKDRRKRVVPFVWLPEAARIFAYAENNTNGVIVKPYADALRVKYEGADIVCEVPSRTKKHSRYVSRLQHVPVDGSTERRAVIWSLRSQYAQNGCPKHETFNIRYTNEHDRESSDVFTFQPHDVAAYLGVISHYTKEHNFTPLEMCPFALVSQKEADFYQRLCNNVVIYDPTLERKDGLRKLHLDEKSILVARSIGVLGHDATMYADPARDGKMKDYSWASYK